MGRGVWVTAHLETGRLLQGRGNLPGAWGWGGEVRGEALKWVAKRGLKGACRGAGSQCPHCRHNPGCRTCCGHLEGPCNGNPTRGCYGRLMGAKEAILLWGAGLALLQGKGTVSILPLEVWLILT